MAVAFREPSDVPSSFQRRACLRKLRAPVVPWQDIHSRSCRDVATRQETCQETPSNGTSLAALSLPKGYMDPKRIITERESHGLKQYQLAKIAGISPSQMSRVEAGKRRLRADEAERIANRLNLNIAEFPRARNCAQLPLPEGMASVEYPSELSPQSRDELKQWLELIAKLASR